MKNFGVGIGILFSTIICTAITCLLYLLINPQNIVVKEYLSLRIIIGIVLLLLGVSIYITAFIQLIKCLKGNILYTKGLYAYIQHPLYFAWILLITPGIILIIGLIPLFFTPFWGLLFFYINIHSEEDELQKRFGKKYEEYRMKTGRLFPRLK